jgi:hypothetical protein
MGSAIAYTKKESPALKQKADIIEYTSKKNRLYRFTPVTKEELERLRVPSYPYLL